MANGTYVQVKMDPSIKKQARAVLDQLGISMSDAVGVYFRQIIRSRGIPFELKLPSDATLEAVKELESGKGATFDTADELFEDLKN
jgi:DNA-damage-inducible protein J